MLASRHTGTASNPRSAKESRSTRGGAVLSVVPVIPITLTIARILGEIDAELRAAGLTTPTSDLLIAATALSRDDGVVTGNARHFGRVPGLTVHVLRGTMA